MPEKLPEFAAPVRKQGRFHLSLVWLVPLVATLVGLSMLVHNWMSVGPKIVVRFETAEGLEANTTLVKFKNVVIGKVTDIDLSDDRSHINATIELNHSALPFTRKDSRFWVVRPRIGASGISGIDTVLSGAFISADAGSEAETAKTFQGLEDPPPVTFGQAGKPFTLHTTELGSLYIGAPIYYRRIPVGQVTSYSLAKDGKGVDVGIFINAPNDNYVTTDSRFWNASGVDVAVSTDGLRINTESLSSVVQGGIAFVEPEYSPNPQAAESGGEFKLFANKDLALAPPDGEAHYIRLHFNHSVRGLAVNSAVEFRGVNLGRVVSINLDYSSQNKSFETVIGALIYPQRLGRVYQYLTKDQDPNDPEQVAKVLKVFVDHGLRAEARTGNLLTGQLYINLDFIKGATPVAFDSHSRPLEIPTVPGGFDEMQEQLQAVLKKVEKLPIDQIGENLNQSLVELQRTLKQVNGQFLPQIQTTLQKATSAIEQADSTIKTANRTLSDDSPQVQQLQGTLDEVQRTLRSVRALSDYLGRHPGALIRGRATESAPDSFQPSTPSRAPVEP